LRVRRYCVEALYREREGIVFNQHYDGDGTIIFSTAPHALCRDVRLFTRNGYDFTALASGAAGIAARIVGAFRRPRRQSSLSGSNVS
jgi:hypothetical protein